ncbi:MAG: hypothetical protein RLZZ308_635 [Candidatus Parcubacteria bacterium]|jgi:hypothetical protein
MLFGTEFLNKFRLSENKSDEIDISHLTVLSSGKKRGDQTPRHLPPSYGGGLIYNSATGGSMKDNAEFDKKAFIFYAVMAVVAGACLYGTIKFISIKMDEMEIPLSVRKAEASLSVARSERAIKEARELPIQSSQSVEVSKPVNDRVIIPTRACSNQEQKEAFFASGEVHTLQSGKKYHLSRGCAMISLAGPVEGLVISQGLFYHPEGSTSTGFYGCGNYEGGVKHGTQECIRYLNKRIGLPTRVTVIGPIGSIDINMQ